MGQSELPIDEIIVRLVEGSKPLQYLAILVLIFLLITRIKRIFKVLSDFFLGDMDDARNSFAEDQAKLIDQNQTLIDNYQEMIEQYQKLLDMLDKTQPSRETIENGFAEKTGTSEEHK